LVVWRAATALDEEDPPQPKRSNGGGKFIFNAGEKTMILTPTYR
jgi:hypothetical protein